MPDTTINKIEINQENYEKILEVTKNSYKLALLSELLLMNKFE